MADERDDSTPTDDARQKDVSGQNAEEGPDATTGPSSAKPDDSAESPNVPGTSDDEEGDAGQATGNPRAAG